MGDAINLTSTFVANTRYMTRSTMEMFARSTAERSDARGLDLGSCAQRHNRDAGLGQRPAVPIDEPFFVLHR